MIQTLITEAPVEALDMTVLQSPKAVTPDEAWLVYTARKQGNSSTQRLMRVPIPGGSPELLFDTGADFWEFTCAKHPVVRKNKSRR